MVLPKTMRIKGHKCFDHIYRSSFSYHGSLMVLRVAKAQEHLIKSKKYKWGKKNCKCAVAISNKVSKKAVKRNSLRRLFHEHLRQRFSKSHGMKGTWTFITLKPSSIKQESSRLLTECDQLLFKAKLLFLKFFICNIMVKTNAFFLKTTGKSSKITLG